jgi:hypothetical protein
VFSITSEEMKQTGLTEDGFTNLCKKNLSNAFENVPLVMKNMDY